MFKLISLTKARKDDLGPLRQATADWMRLKGTHTYLVQGLLYDWPHFCDMIPASRLNTTVADGQQPPLEDRTKGVKSAMLHFNYLLFIDPSLIMLMCSVAGIGCVRANGWSMSIKLSHIKESSQLAVVPRVLGLDV